MTAAVGLLLLCGLPCASAAPVRTSAREIHLLNPYEAKQKQSVHLSGVVTVLSGWEDSFFLQDATSGISVDRLRGATGPVLRSGDRVIVDGVTGDGNFAPIVADARVTLVGHGATPQAPLLRAGDLEWGVKDSQWISVDGEVRSVEHKVIWGRPIVFMTMNIGGPDLLGVHIVQPDAVTDWNALIGTTVRIRGVCGTIWNSLRQFSGLRMFVHSSLDVRMLHAAPSDPFNVPLRTIGGLLQYSRATGGEGQVAVVGTVSAVEPKRGFFLEDSTGGIYVADKQSPVQIGRRVEVVGFPSMNEEGAQLQAARQRDLGPGNLKPVMLRGADEVIVTRDGFTVSQYNARLINVTGTLVDFTPGVREVTLMMKSGDRLFRARIPDTGNGVSWTRGSVLRMVGVCDVFLDDTKTPFGFVLRLRSPEDVTLIQRGPWWTTSRALWLSSALSMLATAMLGWVAFLRRRERLRELLWTDSLTGLYNRRAFLLLAEKQMEATRRKHAALALFYVDVDSFKEINDTYGHRAGDAALEDVARLLRQVFRESDIVCRLGGDEFAVLACDAVQGVEDTMRSRLNEAVLMENQRSERGFRLALSVGALYCDGTCTQRSIEDLLEHADGLMYGNKRRKKQEALVPLAV